MWHYRQSHELKELPERSNIKVLIQDQTRHIITKINDKTVHRWSAYTTGTNITINIRDTPKILTF